MTASTTGAPAAASAAVTPDVRTVARRARGPLLVAGVLVLLGLLALVGSDPGVGLLDTRSASKPGSKAVAELLRDQGVDVRQVRTLDQAAATGGGTLVVAGPDLISPEAAERLAGSGARTVVLVAAGNPEVVSAFAPGVRVEDPVGSTVLDPACPLPSALRAGRATVGGVRYDSATSAGCYPVDGTPSLLVVDTPQRSVVLLGSASILRNDELADEGNAALALNLLGGNDSLTWYLPSLEDLYGAEGARQDSALDLVPRGVVWGAGWLAFVVLLLALWRARRLGRVIVEPLPVVVRASETVEGRARLYRRSHDRGRAAQLLRAATCDRLVPRLGLPTGASPQAVVEAVSRRLGTNPTDIAALLYGAAPSDDARLVRLADELDRLEREVHRT